ncbi:protein of unknown function (plasmid) [Pararobbsia alpina]
MWPFGSRAATAGDGLAWFAMCFVTPGAL